MAGITKKPTLTSLQATCIRFVASDYSQCLCKAGFIYLHWNPGRYLKLLFSDCESSIWSICIIFLKLLLSRWMQMKLHLNQYLLGGVAKNLRWRLSTSSSTGMLSNPHRWPLWVDVIFTQTSLLPEALTPSNKLANKESLSKVKNKKVLGLII